MGDRVGVNHDLRVADGGTIYMPPWIDGEDGWGNLQIPDFYIASAAQKYPRGTMFRKGIDSYVYTKLATTLRSGGVWGSTGYGGISQGQGLFSVAKPAGSLTIVTATKGERTVTISSPALTVNGYAGGLLTLYDGTSQPLCIMGVVSNTATVITLDGVLPGTYTAQSSALYQIVPSPYYSVIAEYNQGASTLFDYCPGIFISRFDEGGNAPAADDFVWLKTAGLVYMWATLRQAGGTGGERVATIMGDMGAIVSDAGEGTYVGYQRIGTLFPSTGDSAVGSGGGPSDGTDTATMQHIILLNIRQ
ncbi:hypothetical protein LCGC14_2428570 [marine sediment metagenome]|uniref:Uncharacterized protein n=1 Tax=marine sediment metagenome TaxID=412755 RepID=A0A0F9BMQ4_9ZZZZ